MQDYFRVNKLSVQRARINLDRGINVDVEDLDLLLMSRWSVNRGYAYGNALLFSGQSKLHRVIMERVIGRTPSKDEVIDHINGNGLDNRRSNLRLATRSQNSANSKRSKRNSTGFKGVTCVIPNQKWKAVIRVNGKSIQLGTFRNPKAAHEAYKAAAIKYRGEFARVE